MKRTVTIVLQGIILFIALAVLVGMLWFPQTEGRATNLDLISIYSDPLIIYVYLASIPFFVTLYQTGKLLRHLRKNKGFSRSAEKAVRIIKYCTFALPILIIAGQVFIVANANGDDFAGPVALGVYATIACLIVATAMAVWQKKLRNA